MLHLNSRPQSGSFVLSSDSSFVGAAQLAGLP
jgi:hypothetical protein